MGDADDDLEFSDTMHMRAGMMMDIPLPDDVTPSDDHQGMLRSMKSMQMEDQLRSVMGAEMAHKVASNSISVEKVTPGDKRQGVPPTPSTVFKQAEAETVRKVLDEVDRTAAKRMREGFNEHTFSAGVLNCFFIAFMFGRYPEHFWLVYLIETAYFIPAKFWYMWRAKPLNEALYYFDLCWFLNFVGMLALSVFSLQFLLGIDMREDVRKHIYLAALGSACGPLTGATMALPFVALLFHDVRTMTGVFIHTLPPFVAYTLRWHGEDIHQAWPSVFSLEYLDEVNFFPESGPFFLPGTGLGSIAGNAIALYVLWFIPYTIWMITVGMDLPRSTRRKLLKDGTPAPARYDTVFHSTVRGGLCILIGKVCWGRSKAVSVKQMETNDFELRDFFAYMAAHATAAITSIYVGGYFCYSYQLAHICFLLLLTCICVYRGAKRYTFYSTAMYGKLIRKNFEDLITSDAETSKSK